MTEAAEPEQPPAARIALMREPNPPSPPLMPLPLRMRPRRGRASPPRQCSRRRPPRRPRLAQARRIAGPLDAIAAGHPGLAYWYSVALDLPEPVQAAFEVLALSAAVTANGDDCSRRIRDLLHDFDVTAVAQSPEYIKVLEAGCARALLRMPFSPCASVLQDAATLDSSAGPFPGAVLQAAAFGLELTKLQQEHGHSLPQLITAREDALSALSSAMETSRKLRTRYTRATNVWRRFVTTRAFWAGRSHRCLPERRTSNRPSRCWRSSRPPGHRPPHR